MTNLVRHLDEAAERHPAAPAVVYREMVLPYGDLRERIGRFAAGLADRGIEAADRVGAYLPNLPPFVTSFFGTLHAGAVVVPMNPQYRSREIGHLLGDSGARVVVTLEDLVPVVEAAREGTAVEHVVSLADEPAGATAFDDFLGDDPVPVTERGDDDIAVQPYTSGTTGQPKGVLLTHRNLAWNADVSADLVEGGLGPDDRMLGVLPLFHIYGMTVTMIATLFSGGSYYPLPEWDAAEAARLVEERELTIMHGVPAMYNDLVTRPDADEYDLSSLRFVNAGGSSLPVEVLRRFEETFGVDLYEGYGLTETSPVTHANTHEARRIGSIGRPIPGVASKVVDEDFEPVPRVAEGPVDEDAVDLDAITGEIVVAGPNVMRGYHVLPEATEAAFTVEGDTRWFHTGDVAYWDEDDFFFVVDRKTDVIVSGGYNVYPREVEELLFEHPAVADVAVVGVPDDRRGEVPKAYVIPAPDAEATPEDLRQYCLDHLAAYKHPREVAFVDDLPRTATGKVQKFELRRREEEEKSEDSPE